MNDKSVKIVDVSPHVIRRECGGWLATAPNGRPFRIGVTAETEAEAREKFSRSVRVWLDCLSGKP